MNIIGDWSESDYNNLIQESAEDLYEDAPCGYLSYLPNGIIIKANKILISWLGYKPEEVINKKRFQDLLTIGSKIFYETHYAPLLNLQGSVNEINFDLISKNNVSIPVLVNTVQLKNAAGKVTVNRATLFNITDRKKYEQELLLAKEKAEEASKIKAEFISTISHEIRNPLNAIIGVSNLLLKDDPMPRQLEYLRIIKYSSDNLLRLINDILDLSKIEAGRVTLNERDFNIQNLVYNMLYSFNLRAEEKNITLKADLDDRLPEFLMGDEVKIGQVLSNLLGNAVKFTQKGSVILQIKVVATDQETITLHFRVIDTGMGIPPERLENIFEEFTQANEDISQQYGGTGLGLTIIKRILDLYNSKIEVKSSPGQGSEFFFDLKLQKSKQVTSSPADRSKLTPFTEKSIAGIRLLLVEDNKINVHVMEQYFRNWNVDFEVARNGLQAISKINEKEFDLILMDLHMPDMDGYEATRWIRNLPEIKYQKLPIIALSASEQYNWAEKMQLAGLTDFIRKPFKPEELHDKIAFYSKRKPIG